MSKPLVYLAGPIAGCQIQEALDWRLEATEDLKEIYGIDALSPMREKHALSTGASISRDFRAYEDRGIFYTSKGIMTRDFNDVKRCDALLVNLYGTKALTTGTVMELGWAYCMQKPVIVWIEQGGNPHDAHPMVHEAIGGLRFDSLDEAVHAVAVVLGRAG